MKIVSYRMQKSLSPDSQVHRNWQLCLSYYRKRLNCDTGNEIQWKSSIYLSWRFYCRCYYLGEGEELAFMNTHVRPRKTAQSTVNYWGQQPKSILQVTSTHPSLVVALKIVPPPSPLVCAHHLTRELELEAPTEPCCYIHLHSPPTPEEVVPSIAPSMAEVERSLGYFYFIEGF